MTSFLNSTQTKSVDRKELSAISKTSRSIYWCSHLWKAVKMFLEHLTAFGEIQNGEYSDPCLKGENLNSKGQITTEYMMKYIDCSVLCKMFWFSAPRESESLMDVVHFNIQTTQTTTVYATQSWTSQTSSNLFKRSWCLLNLKWH